MSQDVEGPQPPRDGKPVKLIALVIVVLLAIVAVYGAVTHFAKPAGSLKPLATGAMSKLVATQPAIAAPDAPFEGPDGKPMRVADLKGKVVLVNLWATWCAPCVKEMPTLAKLKAANAGKPVEVIPVSVDRGEDVDKAKAFIASHPPLTYHHVDTDWVFALKPPAQGFPTTLIFDRQGRERARVSGDSDWSSREAQAVVDALLSEPLQPSR
jgi:thiol-disulfide isomerase/thioredoxin